MILDRRWHTFPVEFRDGRPRVVVLDPVSPSQNSMLAAAYQAGKISPLAEQHLAPWDGRMARNACADDGGTVCYRRAIGSLRNALITGEPWSEPDDIAYVLDRAREDAALWGSQGEAAAGEIQRSIRNLSFKLDTGLVKGFVEKLGQAAEKVAPQALRAALIAEFGPAAAVALQGVDVLLQPDTPSAGPTTPPTQAPKSKQLEATVEPSSTTEPTHAAVLNRLRRMTRAGSLFYRAEIEGKATRLLPYENVALPSVESR